MEEFVNVLKVQSGEITEWYNTIFQFLFQKKSNLTLFCVKRYSPVVQMLTVILF